VIRLSTDETVHVAIDGSALAYPPSGTRTYVEELLNAFRDLSDAVSLTVLMPRSGIEPASDRVARTTGIRKRFQRASWEMLGVARSASRQGADLLHIPRFSAPLRRSSPAIVTIHDLIPLELPEYRSSWWAREQAAVALRTCGKASRIIVPSAFVGRQVMARFGFESSKVSIIPMGVSEKYQPALEMEIAESTRDAPYIFNAGGFDARKNLTLLVEAFALARPSLGAEWRLVITGAPHTSNPVVYPPIEPVIDRFGLKKHVILTGRVSESEKIRLYQGAAIYVTASSYEGFGLTVLEAMACGIPVIASNRTSLPEVAGDAALLVEPDPHDLAAAIVQVAGDAELARRLETSGLGRAAQFSWRRTAQSTLEAYRAAIDR
jgi:glycosyltransferase involved in cell wall biosynthesis